MTRIDLSTIIDNNITNYNKQSIWLLIVIYYHGWVTPVTILILWYWANILLESCRSFRSLSLKVWGWKSYCTALNIRNNVDITEPRQFNIINPISAKKQFICIYEMCKYCNKIFKKQTQN